MSHRLLRQGNGDHLGMRHRAIRRLDQVDADADHATAATFEHGGPERPPGSMFNILPCQLDREPHSGLDGFKDAILPCPQPTQPQRQPQHDLPARRPILRHVFPLLLTYTWALSSWDPCPMPMFGADHGRVGPWGRSTVHPVAADLMPTHRLVQQRGGPDIATQPFSQDSSFSGAHTPRH